MDSEATQQSEEKPASSDAEKRLEEKLSKLNTEPKETEIVTPEQSAPEKSASDLPPPKPSKAEQNTRGEVSAATVARMMGLATASEVSLLEGKIDLLSSRINNVLIKVERVAGSLSQIPTATDLDRIDINIGSLKTMIRETMEALQESSKDIDESEAGKLKKATIMSNDEPEEEAPAEEQPAE